MSTVKTADKLSARARRTSEPPISGLMAQALTVPGIISLAAGFVDQASLPNEDVLLAAEKILGSPDTGRAALQYSSTMGDERLRGQWMARLDQEDGIAPATHGFGLEHVMVGNGSQQLLELVSEALIDPGDIVIVEAPTYFVYLGILESLGAHCISVPCDENGMDTAALRRVVDRLRAAGELSRLKIIYCMTYFTNPMGANLSMERRDELFDIVAELNEGGEMVYLLEDAAYQALRLDGEHLPPVKLRDTDNEFVIYTQSFSKAFSPGFKLGFGILPESILSAVRRLKGNADFGTSNFTMQLAAELFDCGAFDRHGELLRQAYREKRELFWNALYSELPAAVEAVYPRGAFYVWARLSGVDASGDGPLFAAALEEGVLYVPGRCCYAPDVRDTPEAKSSLRLSFGLPEPEVMLVGVERLGRAVRRVLSL